MSKDGFTAGTPLSTLLDDRQSMLAFAMNGKPLPLEHGFPVRIVVPGLYGYVSATKWLTDIEVTRFDQFEAYWTPRGWSAQGPIKLSSRIDVPRSKASTGQVTVAGVAWDQHVGVSKVEVRVDGGAWQEATLATDASIDTWRQWHWSWDAPRGQPRAPGARVRRQGQPSGREPGAARAERLDRTAQRRHQGRIADDASWLAGSRSTAQTTVPPRYRRVDPQESRRRDDAPERSKEAVEPGDLIIDNGDGEQTAADLQPKDRIFRRALQSLADEFVGDDDGVLA